MTDVEIAERTVASLMDKRDHAAQRSIEITVERQKLGYEVHVSESKEAKVKLAKLNALFADLAGEIEGIDDALREARRRLDAAKAAASASDAEERRRVVHGLLQELEACGPAMDRTIEHPEGGLRRINDPQSRLKVAALVGSVLVELRALKLTDVSFPSNYKWDVAAWQDLRRCLLDTLYAGWPGPAQRLTRKERDTFTALLAAFGRIVRSNLEQTTNTERADAA
jgi:hypothetical protein